MKKTEFKAKPHGICPSCGKQFEKFKTTDKYCSLQCYQSSDPAPTKRPAPIPAVSKKRSRQNRIYQARRIVFLGKTENQRCPVYPHLKTTEIHHMMKRRGYADDWARENDIPLYLDVRYWLAVSRPGHVWIEQNPEESYQRGWSVRNNVKTDQ